MRMFCRAGIAPATVLLPGFGVMAVAGCASGGRPLAPLWTCLSLHGLHDVGEEVLGEVRGEVHGLEIGFDLVEVLKSQDIVAHEVRNDSGEEEAQRLDLLTDLRGGRMRERQIEAD